MSKSKYDPAIHHRRSIRLEGHDYAGGGLYFVTICAHRDAGDIFAPDDVRAMVAREWRRSAELRPYVHLGAFVVMADHFHALVRLDGGGAPLGEVVGAFKAAVSRNVRRGGMHPTRTIWHRNYYEMIVRNALAEQKIANYIRMNPWRCVMNFGNGLRGMGNPALWSLKKLGVLCSRNASRPKSLPKAAAYFGGFHSPMEKEILAKLLELKMPVIWCPAWGLDGKIEPEILAALEENRMLILEMKNREGNLAAAEERNRFVLERADARWLPYVSPGGMLDRLVKEVER
jgi:putative transposase